jgi:hypothetical protein
MEAAMKFVACSEDSHEEWGTNSSVNLALCVAVTLGWVGELMKADALPGAKHAAPAIIFSAIGQDRTVTWSFANFAVRDREFSRLLSMMVEPDDSQILEALAAQAA